MPSEKYLKYWPIAVFIVTTGVAFAGNWAVFGVRMSAIEARQDRQGTAIMVLQTQVTGLSNDISAIKSDIGSIKDNVNYIRNRIDRATQ